jgi:hypothetical protein
MNVFASIPGLLAFLLIFLLEPAWENDVGVN